ncbi:probable disease resistance protein At1g15890 [Amaranthus tricolor]|uniref:probable disease resistance protein At1g15890 n=1 Tax=Amaranthus tricolor TaxID=29722 RepID=UPI0025895154|nr:probable disease resistance protein At1g15890 [Amaranthus tricolor]XP_057548527.1 probable disease resistance protein At1g15890 [Amaranthus tricolor]
MDLKTVIGLLGIVPILYNLWRLAMEEKMRHVELKDTLKEVMSKVHDMDQQARLEEQKPGKKRKRVIKAFVKKAKRYKKSSERKLEESQGQCKVKRMVRVPCLKQHKREGNDLLKEAQQLQKNGLTIDEFKTRGEKLLLPMNMYMGETFRASMDSARQAIRTRAKNCIGIYGSVGAGKTDFMKYLYNEIYDDMGFKAVYWATAPDVWPDRSCYNMAMQKQVADGMWIRDFGEQYHNEETRASRIMAQLGVGGEGRRILFLDDVREAFPAYELLGLPSVGTDKSIILVFTTRSKEVCNRMGCDLILKKDLLEKEEAKGMFLRVMRHADESVEPGIIKIAEEVADQCEGMPLVINIEAKFMAGKKDIREWRNRLNELKGVISSIHLDGEAMIVNKLKFGYNCLNDSQTQRCFLDAAGLLAKNVQVRKERIIKKWKKSGLIGMDRTNKYANDQGHTILNQLKRMCLIHVADNQTVTMNKWIRKMAQEVSKSLKR